MDEREQQKKDPEPAAAEARGEPPEPPKEKPVEQAAAIDPYWWAPWAVLIGLVLYGLLGFLGVLTPGRKGPTAADVPTTPPPSASDQRLVPPH